jgi:outer membrane putative beta-barrel porin/alpha-amylase
MRFGFSKFFRAALLLLVWFLAAVSWAQDLAPRAYIIIPAHSNAVNLTYAFFSGNLLLDGALPISGATAKVSVPILSYSHSLRLLGRSASFSASFPYGVGTFRGIVVDAETRAYRSGALDSSFRFSINLKGGPAMDLQEFRKWQQKTLVGVSFKMVAPTGQYEPAKLINYGANRWAFKPEVGLSRRWGHWVVDNYGAVWFFTANRDFFSRNQFSPGTNTQQQSPIFAYEGHLSYDVKPRLWASFDSNFWVGGRSTLNGVENPNTLQRNSRIGGTVSIPSANANRSKSATTAAPTSGMEGTSKTFPLAGSIRGWADQTEFMAGSVA